MSRVDSVGIALQTAKGTQNNVMGYFPPVESAGAPIQREAMEIEETMGHRFPTRTEYGTRYWESPWSGAVRMDSFPRVASAFFGAPVTSQPAAGPSPTVYDHMFDPAAASGLGWYSLLINRTDPTVAITDLLYDARGNEVTISVEPNGFVRFEAGFVALENDDTRPEPVVTRDSSPRLTFDNASVFVSINGGAEEELTTASWSATYSNNLVTDLGVLGSKSLYDLPLGNASCEVKFMPRTDLSEHYRRALLDDPDSVKLRMVVQGPIIEDALRYEVEFTVQLCEYLDAPIDVNAGETLTGVEVTARAAFDDVSGQFVTLRIRNDVASYSA